MKPKSLIRAVLLLFVFGSLAYLAVKESRQWTAPDRVAAQDQRSATGGATSPSAATKPQSNKIVAYYFHTTYRCPTCRRIEAYSKQAIEAGFARELADGRIEFRLVNVEIPENRHYVQEFNLFTKSLVLVRMKDGKQVDWTNLERVWELNGDQAAFQRYVQQGIHDYLEKD